MNGLGLYFCWYLIDWKHPFQLGRCNPQLIPVLRPTCPSRYFDPGLAAPDDPAFCDRARGANLTDPAQPWPPTPPALGSVQRRPGHTTLPGRKREREESERERFLLIVSSYVSLQREHVRSTAGLSLVPAGRTSMEQRQHSQWSLTRNL